MHTIKMQVNLQMLLLLLLHPKVLYFHCVRKFPFTFTLHIVYTNIILPYFKRNLYGMLLNSFLSLLLWTNEWKMPHQQPVAGGNLSVFKFKRNQKLNPLKWMHFSLAIQLHKSKLFHSHFCKFTIYYCAFMTVFEITISVS